MSAPDYDDELRRRQQHPHRGHWVDATHRRAERAKLSARERRVIAAIDDAVTHEDPELAELFSYPSERARSAASIPGRRRSRFEWLRRLFRRGRS